MATGYARKSSAVDAWWVRWDLSLRHLTEFREEAAWPVRCALVLLFAGLTGLSAPLAFSLPFTPVPLTAQVLLALVAGGFLGRYLGPASQAVYVAVGFLGLPWFAASVGGPWFSVGGAGVVLGVSGGYLLGLIVAAGLVGWLLDRRVPERRFVPMLGVLLVGVAVIYAMGALQFQAVLHTSWTTTLAEAVVPFFPGDVLKAVVGAGILSAVVSTRFPSSDESGREAARTISLRELLAAGGLIGAIWALVPLVPWVAAGSDPAAIQSYYLLSAGLSSVGVGLALTARWILSRRGAPASPQPRTA
ncbi:MAG: biotin transporter BioY [Thermoplasmata archaeon]